MGAVERKATSGSSRAHPGNGCVLGNGAVTSRWRRAADERIRLIPALSRINPFYTGERVNSGQSQVEMKWEREISPNLDDWRRKKARKRLCLRPQFLKDLL